MHVCAARYGVRSGEITHFTVMTAREPVGVAGVRLCRPRRRYADEVEIDLDRCMFDAFGKCLYFRRLSFQKASLVQKAPFV